MGLGSDVWFTGKDYCYSPVRYEGKVGQFSALPMEKFTKGELTATQNRGNIEVSAGLRQPLWNPYGLARLELGLARTSFSSENGQCLRYTDMIDPEQGFIKPTRFIIQEFRGSMHFMSLRSNLLFNTGGLDREQRLGFGFFSYLVLHSSYSMQGEIARSHEIMTYTENDIALRDFVAKITPELIYQCFLFNVGDRRLFLSVAVSSPIRHFVRFERGKWNDPQWMSYAGIVLE